MSLLSSKNENKNSNMYSHTQTEHDRERVKKTENPFSIPFLLYFYQ